MEHRTKNKCVNVCIPENRRYSIVSKTYVLIEHHYINSLFILFIFCYLIISTITLLYFTLRIS